jgi:hypothetical protein
MRAFFSRPVIVTGFPSSAPSTGTATRCTLAVGNGQRVRASCRSRTRKGYALAANGSAPRKWRTGRIERVRPTNRISNLDTTSFSATFLASDTDSSWYWLMKVRALMPTCTLTPENSEISLAKKSNDGLATKNSAGYLGPFYIPSLVHCFS